jgi:hypothetical protein
MRAGIKKINQDLLKRSAIFFSLSLTYSAKSSPQFHFSSKPIAYPASDIVLLREFFRILISVINGNINSQVIQEFKYPTD